MEYFEVRAFMASVQTLHQKGMYTNAVQEVEALRSRIYDGLTEQDVFRGLKTTNFGESRIAHCMKYDLQGRARLVTVVNNGACILLFAGTHDDADRWLDSNKGMQFVGTKTGSGVTLMPLRKSNKAIGLVAVAGTEIDYTPGPLIASLSDRQRHKLLEGLPTEIVDEIALLDSMVTDEQLIDLALQCGSDARVTLVHDVLSYLRAGVRAD